MPQLVSKPPSFFKPDPDQPRKHFPQAEEALLGASLLKKQLVPLLARSDGMIIDGERRWRAAKLVGITILDAIITDEKLSASQIKEMQLVTAMQRSDLKAIEQVDGLEELARLNPGMGNKELANLLNIDPSMVTRLRSVARCIPAVREALSAGTIGISDAYALSKCSTPEEQATLLSQKLGGASRDSIEQAGRKNRTGTVAALRVSRIRCPVPGKGATVVVSGAAISLGDMIEAMSDLLKLAKRESEKGIDARTFEKVCRALAKKG